MFVSPQLLHKAADNLPFDDVKWITELKLDGIRLLYTKLNGVTRLYTRHNNEVTSLFPEIASVPLPDGVYDGELIVPGIDGKPNFEAMMSRFKSLKAPYQVQFAIFDVIYVNDKKVTHLPLLERKQLLEELLPTDSELVTKVKWLSGNAKAYFELIKQHDLEGIVQKKADAPYLIGRRSKEVLKVINYKYTRINIVGYSKKKFGLLLQFDDNEPAGVMEFMPPTDRRKFYQYTRDNQILDKGEFVYIKPLSCNVKYRNLTSNGKLRIPSFESWVS